MARLFDINNKNYFTHETNVLIIFEVFLATSLHHCCRAPSNISVRSLRLVRKSCLKFSPLSTTYKAVQKFWSPQTRNKENMIALGNLFWPMLTRWISFHIFMYCIHWIRRCGAIRINALTKTSDIETTRRSDLSRKYRCYIRNILDLLCDLHSIAVMP